jgi:hypothetical protein
MVSSNGGPIHAPKGFTNNDIATPKMSVNGNSPSLLVQLIRVPLFFLWFGLASLTIITTEFLGVPIAFFSKDLFYAYGFISRDLE